VFSQATFALCPESDPQKGFPFNKSPQFQSPVLCCSVKLPPFCLRSELRPWSPRRGDGKAIRTLNTAIAHTSTNLNSFRSLLIVKEHSPSKRLPLIQGSAHKQKTILESPRKHIWLVATSTTCFPKRPVTTETHLVGCDEHHVFSQATSHHGNTSGWLRRAPRVFPSDLWKVLRPQTIPEPSSTLQKGNTPQQHEVSFQNPDSFPRVQSLCRFSQRLPKVG